MFVTEFVDFEEARKNRERIELTRNNASKEKRGGYREPKLPRLYEVKQKAGPQHHYDKVELKVDKVKSLRLQGLTIRQIVSQCHVGKGTVQNIIKELESEKGI